MYVIKIQLQEKDYQIRYKSKTQLYAVYSKPTVNIKIKID